MSVLRVDLSTRGRGRTSDPARARKALARIRGLYDIEAEVKALGEVGRLGAFHTRSRPLLDALFEWVEEKRSQALPKSPMGLRPGTLW
jgi:hypothetical protein